MGYQFPVYEMSLLPGVFFQQLLLKIQNHIDQELKTALLIQESLRRVLQKFHEIHLKITRDSNTGVFL